MNFKYCYRFCTYQPDMVNHSIWFEDCCEKKNSIKKKISIDVHLPRAFMNSSKPSDEVILYAFPSQTSGILDNFRITFS